MERERERERERAPVPKKQGEEGAHALRRRKPLPPTPSILNKVEDEAPPPPTPSILNKVEEEALPSYTLNSKQSGGRSARALAAPLAHAVL
jgi:hypothetical protein